MIRIENPRYMTRKEVEEKYPNYLVCMGKYRSLKETNGNDGGYPLLLVEKHELGDVFLEDSEYDEWSPVFELSTFPMAGFLSVYRLEGQDYGRDVFLTDEKQA
ncbi:MAG: hypothetical protein FWG65_09800 [Turicibacter sp.]|nr:hypothetical protein [Turicibacter sp.]